LADTARRHFFAFSISPQGVPIGSYAILGIGVRGSLR